MKNNFNKLRAGIIDWGSVIAGRNNWDEKINYAKTA
jgi:hypothetical protein